MTSPQQRFAHLTWLAVWYKPSEVTGASACTEKQEGADDGEAFPRDGLLLFQDVDEKATEESKRKRFGLAQGLIDFVRYVSPPPL